MGDNAGINKRRIILQGIGVVALVALAIWFASFVSGSAVVQDVVSRFGYLGILIVSVVSGFNVVIPVPVAAFAPVFIEAGFMFLPVVFLMSLGMTLGDGLGMLIGSAGRKIADLEKSKSKIWKKIEKFSKEHENGMYIFLFLYAEFILLRDINEFINFSILL